MIKKGSKGEEVRKWQKFLKSIEYDIEVTGTFDEDTFNATVHFQSENDLDDDGIVGRGTYAAAEDQGYGEEEEEDDKPAKKHIAIRHGSRGDEVKQWQKFLLSLDYEIGKADGIYGDATYEATTHFQEENGLDADGIVGKKTYAAAVEAGYEGDFA
ncbi:MAG: hypothetical protein EAZ97_06090 [Bacteroidetes bacterium]|nr:MAG: hypothetical protein EAZ97_06090 [Bacteroidota bacterium]